MGFHLPPGKSADFDATDNRSYYYVQSTRTYISGANYHVPAQIISDVILKLGYGNNYIRTT